jgi:hypothetical protein
MIGIFTQSVEIHDSDIHRRYCGRCPEGQCQCHHTLFDRIEHFRRYFALQNQPHKDMVGNTVIEQYLTKYRHFILKNTQTITETTPMVCHDTIHHRDVRQCKCGKSSIFSPHSQESQRICVPAPRTVLSARYFVHMSFV